MKTNILLVSALVAGLFFTGCKKNDGANPVQENNVPNGTVGINLSVHVLGSSQANARVEGLKDATVIISNNGGTSEQKVGESGIASFEGLKEGAISIYVKMDGYTTVNTSGSLSYNGTLDVGGNNTQDGAVSGTDAYVVSANRIDVTLPRNAGSVRAKLRGDFDVDAATPITTAPANVPVYARISNDYQPNVFSTTTDGNGSFAFDNLPEGVTVTFSTDYTVSTTVAATPGETAVSYDVPFSFPGTTVIPVAGQVKQLGLIQLTH